MENKYTNLIIEVIKQNPRFVGNEHLLNEIYDDAVVRLGGILESVKDEAIVRSYVERIAKLSIITVSRNNGGSTKKQVVTRVAEVKEIQLAGNHTDHYQFFEYESDGFETLIELTDVQRSEIEAGIQKLEKEYPTKEFIKLYRLRYQEHKTLEDISDTMNVSQAQAAERLFEITALVKRICSDELSQV